ncbi:RNA recognition motif [Popillia japonica]|uniref:RNA recognition motif n=1 Tax=Popillia japonica TaxID=7064 RepID=A0AAW1MEL5_POPJA
MEDPDRTIFCGNLSSKVTEEILYELFLQAAPLEKVKIPLDKDVPYAVDLMQGISLYQKKIIVKPRSGSVHGYQENGRQYTPAISKVENLNEVILGGQMQVNNVNCKRYDISPVSRRDRGFSHSYDRRNDKPYGKKGKRN